MNTKHMMILARILRILRYLMIAVMVLALLAIIIFWINPSFAESLDWLFIGDTYIDLDGLKIYTGSMLYNPEGFLMFLRILCVMLIISCALILAALRLIEDLVRDVIKGEAFTNKAIDCMEKLAWLSLAIILLTPALSGTTQYFFLKSFDFSHLLASGVAYSVGFDYVLEVSQLIIPAFLFVLCAVFRQGKKLQEFSDDTV